MSSVLSAWSSEHPDLDMTLAYHLDIAISIVIIIFALLNAPRALARFANHSERFCGHILRYVSLHDDPRIDPDANSKKCAVDIHTSSAGDDLTFNALPALPMQILQDTSGQEKLMHMRMLSSLVPPVAGILSCPVHEEYTIRHVLLMAGYTAMVFYCGFYKSNPFSHPSQAGWVITSQVPFVYMFATKNNIVGALVGAGYERLNYLH
ncbi:hypothetical protein BKA82DRAFT_20237 [Pisolithus tinctorius]|uniref:Uncharacterized protein n=1 Tax=Pisolithus tinctorius Marx 270 TaxID=870435 RepID=A0A0C3PRA1_PISTI|nr:hypothetical protein BKA82DRAFT_20237 [Pisolithus tinctorius]KIO11581.1 hypothetical protein M404DRAFT_20237 [Pisolithus tinctorius Marx 270]